MLYSRRICFDAAQGFAEVKKQYHNCLCEGE